MLLLFLEKEINWINFESLDRRLIQDFQLLKWSLYEISYITQHLTF